MNAQSSYDERGLLLQTAAGSEAAFSTLFHAWRDKLYFFLLRITSSPEIAEDMLQDVFIKLWLNRETLNSVDNFSAYVYRLTQNHALNGIRRMSMETLIMADLRRQTISGGQAPDEILLLKQTQEKVKDILDNLPLQQKLVYTLIREKGLKHDEVARQLNLSTSTVKNHMTQALKTIRSQLGGQYPTLALYCVILMVDIYYN